MFKILAAVPGTVGGSPGTHFYKVAVCVELGSGRAHQSQVTPQMQAVATVRHRERPPGGPTLTPPCATFLDLNTGASPYWRSPAFKALTAAKWDIVFVRGLGKKGVARKKGSDSLQKQCTGLSERRTVSSRCEPKSLTFRVE